MDWCTKAADAFASIAESAERWATREAGEEAVGNLVPEDVSRLAEKAAAYAAKNPFAPLFPFPDPLAKLAGMVERVRGLESPQARRREGVELAMESAVCAAALGMRVERLLEKRVLESEAKARIAEAEARAAEAEAREAGAEAEMYKAQGKAEAEAEARKRAEAARARAEDERREKTAQLAASEAGRLAAVALAADYRRLLDGKLAGLPAVVRAAMEAWEKPFQMAAKLEKEMAKEMGERAKGLWYAVREAGSLNKAHAEVGLSYGTAYRLWDDEVRPFLARHSIPDPVAVSHEGRTQVVSLDRMEGWGKRD